MSLTTTLPFSVHQPLQGVFGMFLICLLVLAALIFILYLYTRATRSRQMKRYEEMRRDPDFSENSPSQNPYDGSFPMPSGRRRTRWPVIIMRPPFEPPRPSQNRSGRKPPRSGGGFGSGGFGGGGFGGGLSGGFLAGLLLSGLLGQLIDHCLHGCSLLYSSC